MSASVFLNPELTVALALFIGIIAHILSHHGKIPVIVLLLAAGVLLGPDGAGIIHPETLGSSLNVLTGFAVAVILFEGGLNLKFSRLRNVHRTVGRLILSGGLFSLIGGAAVGRFFLHWPWWTAFLFGTLAMVTGPTVINPLMSRLKVRHSTAAILEAEGVLIDAVGGIVATVALFAVLSPAEAAPAVFVWHVFSRLVFGAACGTILAFLLIALYRRRGLIPEGLENVFTLTAVLILFQGCNLILTESGLAAVVTAGIVVGNNRTYALEDLAEFKEELTAMLIGMLFVLLAADVRLAQVVGLGVPGLAVVLVLMFLVRPAAVFTGTMFCGLSLKERFFIAWIGPRGIVAAAVASFFAVALEENGLPLGHELRALVFLLIAASVLSAGLTGGMLAGWLGLRRPTRTGWVILGACATARALSKLMKEHGQETVLIDNNPKHCEAAERDCTRVIFGRGLSINVIRRAQVDTRRGSIALTPNDEVNFLFIKHVKKEVKDISLYAALGSVTESLTKEMLHEAGAELAFGSPINIEYWDRGFREKMVHLHLWEMARETGESPDEEAPMSGYPGKGVIPVALRREEDLTPVGDGTRLKKGDEVWLFIHDGELKEAEDFLSQAGWVKKKWEDKESFSTSVCHLEKDSGQ